MRMLMGKGQPDVHIVDRVGALHVSRFQEARKWRESSGCKRPAVGCLSIVEPPLSALGMFTVVARAVFTSLPTGHVKERISTSSYT